MSPMEGPPKFQQPNLPKKEVPESSIEAAPSPRLTEATKYLVQIATEIPSYTGRRVPWELIQTGAVQALEFLPYQDVMELESAVHEMPEGEAKRRCDAILSEIDRLFKEEKAELERKNKPELPDCKPEVEAIEKAFVAFESRPDMADLLAITDAEEALASGGIREKAKNDLVAIGNRIIALKTTTTITSKQFLVVYGAYKAITQRVLGTIKATPNGTKIIDRTEN